MTFPLVTRRRSRMDAVVAALLCAVSLPPSVYAAPPMEHSGAASIASADSNDKVLHALNRLTFGPRPQDEEHVRQIGLNAWFEEQLHPARLDDSALEERLSAFPALSMPIETLMKHYPPQQVIRRLAYRSGPGAIPSLPRDPGIRAIYQDQTAAFLIAREGKADKEESARAEGMEDARSAAIQANAVSIDPATPPGTSMHAAAPTNDQAMEQRVPPMPREQVRALIEMAPEQRYQAILSMKPTEALSLFKTARLNAPSPTPLGQRLEAGMTPLQCETLRALPNSYRMLSNEVLSARLLRDVYSQRQLEAVMTDFWLNHFNVYLRKNQDEVFTLSSYEREVIRKHALGSFEDLLYATATSPAMLMYLDNAQSIGPHSKAGIRGAENGAKNTGLNENYARELMELHTLGVNGGYTQHDVTEVAKVFTGWTIERHDDAIEGFTFNERRHEPGVKQVLGQTIAPAGESEGREVLHLLATRPATAQFISRKLAVRFVSDNPPQSLVNAMSKTFLESKGNISEVLRTMFHRPEFWAASSYRAKLKTPLEYVVSAARVSGAEVQSAGPLVQALDRLGMPLFGMQTPNGYAWTESQWLSTSALVNRMNFALVLSTNRIPGTEIDWDARMQQASLTLSAPVAYKRQPDVQSTVQQKEHALEAVVLGFTASEKTRQTVLQQETDDLAKQAAEQVSFSVKGVQGSALQDSHSMQAQSVDPSMRPAIWGVRQLQPRDAQAAAMAGLLLGSPEFQRR